MTRALDRVLLVVAGVLAWQLAHEWAGDVALTAPRDTVEHALTLLGSARFWPHVRETAQAFAWALALSALGGLALGVWLGAHRLSGEVAEPVLVALYAIPKITLYPVILLLFGLGLSAKVAFGAIHGVIPTALFAMTAVRTIAPVHLKTARALRLTPAQAAWSVWLPAALPGIVTIHCTGFSLT